MRSWRPGVALPRIAAVFGPDALLADGSLNRAWLAERVFGRDAAPGARERLDDIEHPLIYAEAARLERRNPGAKVIVHDVPLLTEVIRSIPFQFDHIVTVEAPEQMRIRRMVATRGMTERQAADRIRSQSSTAERRELADIVIDSTRPIPDMLAQVDGLYRRWKAH